MCNVVATMFGVRIQPTVMTAARALAVTTPAFLAAALLCASPAAADVATRKPAAEAPKPAAKKQKVASASSAAPAGLKSETLGSFTPPMLDSLRAPAAGSAVQERTFRFTPSGRSSDRKALSVGMTSRVVRAVTPESARPSETQTAAAYNVGISVGYAGFALSGGFSRLDSILEPTREGIDLGLSYRGKRWKTALQLGAEHALNDRASPLARDKRYSVELGGAYLLNPRLSVIGGVRYQMSEPDPFGFTPSRALSDSGEAGAVYLGTSISF